ncbi:SLBB domain-containing protein [Ruficoccus amylovorans]|uniref:SLBB domain-containing protein n=1 Tax=Ruficoccus amylovorans TaxID=1804625 RepID=A0A842HHF1_9BACT|nr:SLBB domain-containing protein [Ruficoccus amylovorans]MBC2595600.1 SLBB domain-containing protein [Ruficoccus amylovorans]
MITVYCHGNVKAPGTYQVQKGTTLLQLMYYAGGITQPTTLKIREVKEGKTYLYSYTFEAILSGKDDDVILQDHCHVIFPWADFSSDTPEKINPLVQVYVEEHYPNFRVIREVPRQTDKDESK